MSRHRWAQWRATTLWSGAGSMWRRCRPHAAPPPSCRHPAWCSSSAESPRDPVMQWKPSAYRKQCDTSANANTRRKTSFLFMCVQQKHMNWIQNIGLIYIFTLMSNWWIPLVDWEASFWYLTSILRQIVLDDEFKMKNVQAGCSNCQGQKTDSFSTLAKSRGRTKRKRKKPTHTYGVWRNNTPLNC